MAFEVTVHPGKAILEIVYPAVPSAADVEAYGAQLRKVIPTLAPEWASLVDQQSLVAMPKTLLRSIATLNVYAEAHGMKRSARVVSGASEGMYAWRIAREGAVRVPIRSFQSREEALNWLLESAGE